MEIFREFVDENEREAYIESERLKNEREHCYALLEMVQIKYEQRLRDIELQVLEEGGTYDDYAFLVKEAEEQKAAEEDGIFQKLWNIILSILRSIKEFLFGKGKEIPPDTEIDVPENFAKVGETLTNLSNSNKIFDFIKWFVITGGAGAGILFVQDKYVKMKYKDVQSWAQKINSALSNMQKSITDFIKDSKFGQLINGFIQQHKAQIEAITGPIKAGASWVAELFAKAFTEVNSVLGKIKDKILGSKDNTQQGQQQQGQPQQQSQLPGPTQNQQGQQQGQQPGVSKRNPTQDYGSISNQNAANKAQEQKRDISYGGFVYRVINNVINVKHEKQPDSTFKPLDKNAIAKLPKSVRRPLGFESADDEYVDLSDVRLALGPAYEVTLVSEDAIDIKYLGDDIKNDIIYEALKDDIENYISVEESVFGSNINDEVYFKESDEEKQMAELEAFSQLFDLL